MLNPIKENEIITMKLKKMDSITSEDSTMNIYSLHIINRINERLEGELKAKVPSELKLTPGDSLIFAIRPEGFISTEIGVEIKKELHLPEGFTLGITIELATGQQINLEFIVKD